MKRSGRIQAVLHTGTTYDPYQKAYVHTFSQEQQGPLTMTSSHMCGFDQVTTEVATAREIVKESRGDGGPKNSSDSPTILRECDRDILSFYPPGTPSGRAVESVAGTDVLFEVSTSNLPDIMRFGKPISKVDGGAA